MAPRTDWTGLADSGLNPDRIHRSLRGAVGNAPADRLSQKADNGAVQAKVVFINRSALPR